MFLGLKISVGPLSLDRQTWVMKYQILHSILLSFYFMCLQSFFFLWNRFATRWNSGSQMWLYSIIIFKECDGKFSSCIKTFGVWRNEQPNHNFEWESLNYRFICRESVSINISEWVNKYLVHFSPNICTIFFCQLILMQYYFCYVRIII